MPNIITIKSPDRKSRRSRIWAISILVVVLVGLIGVAIVMKVFNVTPEVAPQSDPFEYVDSRQNIDASIESIDTNNRVISVIVTAGGHADSYNYTNSTKFSKGDAYNDMEPSSLKKGDLVAIVLNTKDNVVESVWSPKE